MVYTVCFSVSLEVFELKFRSMFAFISNFIASVQRFQRITFQYLVFFADTEIALACPTLVGTGLALNFPFDSRLFLFGLEFPNVLR